MKTAYFRYIKKKMVGYAKISQQSDIKILKKCSLEGFHFIREYSGVVYFSIDNQLYRLLKLSYLGNQPMKHNVKMLHFMVESSDRIDKSEIKFDYSGYWYNSHTYEYFDNELLLNMSEHKERLRNQNKYYKHQYKLKK